MAHNSSKLWWLDRFSLGLPCLQILCSLAHLKGLELVVHVGTGCEEPPVRLKRVALSLSMAAFACLTDMRECIQSPAPPKDWKQRFNCYV